MRTTTLLCLSALALAVIGVRLEAHGGAFRGPIPVRGPTRPDGPQPRKGPKVAPNPVQPLRPGPAFTPGRGGTPLTGGSDADTTSWQAWWEFHRDVHLRLKDVVRTGGPVTGVEDWYMGPTRRPSAPIGLGPTKRQKTDQILPALIRALQDSNQPDLVTACLIAIAKLGVDDEQVVPLLSSYLRHKQQEIRETAALSLGISGKAAALPMLEQLALETKQAKLLLGARALDNRTRAFAIYGLGILAGDSGKLETKRRAANVLRKVLLEQKPESRDVRVACVNALGVLRVGSDTAESKRVLWQVLEDLRGYYESNLGKGEGFVQAHAPIAIARLLGRGASPEHRRYEALFAKELRGRSKRNPVVVQSAALALGKITTTDEGSAATRAALQSYHKTGKDQQARYFCLIALGQIGGDDSRKFLLEVVSRGNRVLERPWAALGLGVMVRAQQKTDAAARDATVVGAITDQLRGTKNPGARAAHAVALGLCGSEEAGPVLRELLKDHEKQDELAGYIAIGLALLGDEKSVPAVRNLVTRAVRRPELMKQAAMALGKLGDKAAADLLVELIRNHGTNTARMASVAAALGYIGDRGTVKPLITMLEDDGLTRLGRAFVAAALGSVADHAPLPFNTRYAIGSNYRSSVPTLTNGSGTGILDLL